LNGGDVSGNGLQSGGCAPCDTPPIIASSLACTPVTFGMSVRAPETMIQRPGLHPS
jgi:hypothetical protein